MGWSLGFDTKWNRDIGYGVPAICDFPDCNKKINRGLSYVCGSEPYGGDYGCGLYFCSKHLSYWRKPHGSDRAVQQCTRCGNYRPPFEAKKDHKEWIRFKLEDKSWKQWREENDDKISDMKIELKIQEEDMKKCQRCLIYKHKSDFWKNINNNDGLERWCESCFKETQLVRRSNNREDYRAKERAYLKTDKGREIAKRNAIKNKLFRPLAYKAVILANKAVKRGILKKQPCVYCGEKKAQKHHPDYTKPLEVIWLCSIHHKQLHLGRISL